MDSWIAISQFPFFSSKARVHIYIYVIKGYIYYITYVLYNRTSGGQNSRDVSWFTQTMISEGKAKPQL
jgi:hypothetical protein